MRTSAAGPSEAWLENWKELRDLERNSKAFRRRDRWKLMDSIGPRTNIWHWLHLGPFRQCGCRMMWPEHCRSWVAYVSASFPDDPVVRAIDEYGSRYGDDQISLMVATAMHGKVSNIRWRHYLDRCMSHDNPIV